MYTYRQSSPQRRPLFWGRALALGLGLTLTLSACNDPNPGPAPYTTLLGFARLGVPIANGMVTAKCGNGIVRTTVSNTQGKWAVNVPPSSLPCAVAITGGMIYGEPNTLVLYSVTTDSLGIVITNTTPFTTLALALAVDNTTGESLSDWFNRSDVHSTLETLLANLPTAQNTLQTIFANAGYTWPSDFNPFTAGFTGDLDDPHARMLRLLNQAMYNSATTYSTLLENFIADGTVPPRTQPGTVHEDLFGQYTLTFFKDGAEGDAPLSEGQQAIVLIKSDTSDNNILKILGKTLTDPFVKDYGSGPNTEELIWFDDQTNIAYILTNNAAGTFMAIKVADFAQPQGAHTTPKFLGNLR
jgi:hypothetical protein